MFFIFTQSATAPLVFSSDTYEYCRQYGNLINVFLGYSYYYLVYTTFNIYFEFINTHTHIPTPTNANSYRQIPYITN